MDVGIPESTAIGMLIIVIAMVIGVFLGAYLVGSIPFGYLVGRLFFHTDIRRQGSGNTGAMNALRALGMRGAALVLLLDALKGFVPTLWALNVFNGFLDTPGFPPGGQIIAALVATGTVLGHCYSPWLRFRGGKGVATVLRRHFCALLARGIGCGRRLGGRCRNNSLFVGRFHAGKRPGACSALDVHRVAPRDGLRHFRGRADLVAAPREYRALASRSGESDSPFEA